MDTVPASLPDLHSHWEWGGRSNENCRCSHHQWGQHQKNSSSTSNEIGIAVINFSSTTSFEAGEGAGLAGSNSRLLTTNQGFQKQKVAGGRALEMRNNNNPLFTTDEQRAVNNKSQCLAAITEKICQASVAEITTAIKQMKAELHL